MNTEFNDIFEKVTEIICDQRSCNNNASYRSTDYSLFYCDQCAKEYWENILEKESEHKRSMAEERHSEYIESQIKGED